MSLPGDPPAAGGAPGGDPAAGGQPEGWQPVRHIGPSLRIGEIVSLGGALLLLVALIALRWYGVAGTGGLERAGPSRALGAWQSMTVARWLLVATVALTLGATGVRLLRRGRAPGAAIAGMLVLAGGATALVLAYRVLFSPPQPQRVFDVKLGAALGLTGAAAIAAGSWESWRSARAPRGSAGREPFSASEQSRLTPAR